jgi:hypothetical protein
MFSRRKYINPQLNTIILESNGLSTFGVPKISETNSWPEPNNIQIETNKEAKWIDVRTILCLLDFLDFPCILY